MLSKGREKQMNISAVEPKSNKSKIAYYAVWESVSWIYSIDYFTGKFVCKPSVKCGGAEVQIPKKIETGIVEVGLPQDCT